MTHSQDIAEIKKELEAFAKKHKAFLSDYDAGGFIENAILDMQETIESKSEEESENAYYDRAAVIADARRG